MSDSNTRFLLRGDNQNLQEVRLEALQEEGCLSDFYYDENWKGKCSKKDKPEETFSDIFVRHVDGNRRVAKVLFIMGATWHNKCLFDIDAEEESMADILNGMGIETYTFDNFGIGPGEKPEPIGNFHQKNMDKAIAIIKHYNIDYIMPYSYGCLMLPQILKAVKVNGTILLDPCPRGQGIVKQNIGGGKLLVAKAAIISALKGVVKSPINDSMLEAYLRHLCDGDYLTTAEYPVTESIAQKDAFLSEDNIRDLYKAGPITAVFTSGVSAEVQALFPKEGLLVYPKASHWIFLEDDRYQLAQDILTFIKQTNK